MRARSGDPGIAAQNTAVAVENSSALGVWSNSQMSQCPLFVCISTFLKKKKKSSDGGGKKEDENTQCTVLNFIR